MRLPISSPTKITSERVRYEIQGRFNPLRGLTPQRVVQLLEDYDRGELRECAWMMEKVEKTDDMVKTVAGKRKKALGSLEWSIRPYENWEAIGSARELQEQTKFLQHLYNSMEVTHALERDLRGGLRLAVMQMADAVGKGYAVHEIDWRPRGDSLMEVGLTFVPLWFFESTTGSLRFLPAGGTSRGEELEEGAWMVTMGDGLMIATLTAYIYKTLPLKDWLTYSERCGMPFLSMVTDATPHTPEWYENLEALAQIASDYAALHSRNAEFQVHDLTVSGQLPFPPLVERMDRAIAMLWRGADLSTLSGEDQLGASLQQGESDLLIEDDVSSINETFEHAISLPSLRWRFGDDVRPMCFFALAAPDRLDEEAEQNKMHKAADYGVEIPVSDYRERLNLPGAGEKDTVLKPPAREVQSGFGAFANEQPTDRMREKAIEEMAQARAKDFAQVLAAIDGLESASDPDDYVSRLEELRDGLAEMMPQIESGAYAETLERIFGSALAAGAMEDFLQNEG